MHFLQGLKHCVSMTLDWGSLMSVIGHDSFLGHLGIVHGHQSVELSTGPTEPLGNVPCVDNVMTLVPLRFFGVSDPILCRGIF